MRLIPPPRTVSSLIIIVAACIMLLFALNAASQEKPSIPEEMNGWAEGGVEDESGASYFFKGKVHYQTIKRSIEEHIADCYNMEGDSAEK